MTCLLTNFALVKWLFWDNSFIHAQNASLAFSVRLDTAYFAENWKLFTLFNIVDLPTCTVHVPWIVQEALVKVKKKKKCQTWGPKRCPNGALFKLVVKFHCKNPKVIHTHTHTHTHTHIYHFFSSSSSSSSFLFYFIFYAEYILYCSKNTTRNRGETNKSSLEPFLTKA